MTAIFTLESAGGDTLQPRPADAMFEHMRALNQQALNQAKEQTGDE